MANRAIGTEAQFEDDNDMLEKLEDEKLKACLRLLHLARLLSILRLLPPRFLLG